MRPPTYGARPRLRPRPLHPRRPHRLEHSVGQAGANARRERPFFHGTKADLRVGDLLRPGFRSNYRPEVVMNHIYFTALPDSAGLAAELASGEGAPRVYAVEPTGRSRTTQT